MISKKEEKFIRSLQRKKHRREERQFLIEGHKLLQELKNSDYELVALYSIEENRSFCDQLFPGLAEIIDKKQMKSISCLNTPPGIVGIVKEPARQIKRQELILYLDGVADPGNLGTIIRTAEGFNVKQLVLSPNCVELFSPKVVQASMGSIFRMSYETHDLQELSHILNDDYVYYAADMGGEVLYEADLNTPAVLIMGSESQGISEEAKKIADKMISIPISSSLESLNVAMSNAIILSEFKRRKLI